MSNQTEKKKWLQAQQQERLVPAGADADIENTMMPDITDWVFMVGGVIFWPILPITILWYVLRRVPGVKEWFVKKAQELRGDNFPGRALPAPQDKEKEGTEQEETEKKERTRKLNPHRADTPARERAAAPAQQRATTTAPSLPDGDHPMLPETVRGQRTHLYLTGPVGAGKTTVLHTLAQSWGEQGAGEMVIVLDPNAVAGGRYPGYRVVGAGGNNEQVCNSLIILQEELDRRQKNRARGIVSPRMRFLVDEASSIATMFPELWLVVMSDLALNGHRLGVYGVWASRSRDAMGSDIPSILTLALSLSESGGRLLRFGEQEYVLPALPDPDTTIGRTQ